MRVQVKFFAIFSEMIGVKSEWADVAAGTTVEQLWTQYASRGPRVVKMRAAYAVNQRLAKPEQVLQEGDEVGFLPPVSGGRTEAKSKKPKAKSGRSKRAITRRAKTPPKNAYVTRRRLDVAELVKQVEFSGAGAILVFSGVVRDNAQGKSVDHLEYEAYPEMAETTMQDILNEIHERWSDVHVAMAHRIGRLKIGDASLIIAIAAPHRPEAYAASRYAIERVKAAVPVWKKEFSADGEYWVEGPVAGETPPEKADSIVRDAEYTPY